MMFSRAFGLIFAHASASSRRHKENTRLSMAAAVAATLQRSATRSCDNDSFGRRQARHSRETRSWRESPYMVLASIYSITLLTYCDDRVRAVLVLLSALSLCPFLLYKCYPCIAADKAARCRPGWSAAYDAWGAKFARRLHWGSRKVRIPGESWRVEFVSTGRRMTVDGFRRVPLQLPHAHTSPSFHSGSMCASYTQSLGASAGKEGNW